MSTNDYSAILAQCKSWFLAKNHQKLQENFAPLIKKEVPEALLLQVDFLIKSEPNKAINYLYRLAKQDVPLANYKMAMLLYFHPEVELNFQDFLKRSCELQEAEGIIFTANLLAPASDFSAAYNFLDSFKHIAAINAFISTFDQTFDTYKLGVSDIDFVAFSRFELSTLNHKKFASEIKLYTVENFISAFECHWLIEQAKNNIQRSEVVNGETGAKEVSDVRTGSVAQLFPTMADWILLNIEKKIEQLVSCSMFNGEVSNVLHYGINEQYKAHYDFFHPNDPGAEIAKQDGGQRFITALINLNDDFEGGETCFPRLSQSITPKQGQLIVFNNTNNQFNPLPLSLHQGNPVLAGNKWLYSKWIREKPTSYKNLLTNLNL